MIKFREAVNGLSYKIGNWGVEDMSDLPEGSIPLPLKSRSGSGDYSKYNIAWEHPNFKGQNVIVSSFILDDFNKNFRFTKDIERLSEINLSRLNLILNDLIKGKYVYNDNDLLISRKFNDRTDPIMYKWDTQTHYLHDFQHRDLSVLPYSKTLDKNTRLTYMVHKPVKDESKWVCHIELSRCYKHTYQEASYSDYIN